MSCALIRYCSACSHERISTMDLTSQVVVFSLFLIVSTVAAASPVNDSRQSGSSSLLEWAQNTPLRDILSLNPSLSTSLFERKVTCDPRRFGTPPIASCSDAISQMPQLNVHMIDRKRSYGPCGGAERYDVELPRRWISCKARPSLK